MQVGPAWRPHSRGSARILDRSRHGSGTLDGADPEDSNHAAVAERMTKPSNRRALRLARWLSIWMLVWLSIWLTSSGFAQARPPIAAIFRQAQQESDPGTSVTGFPASGQPNIILLVTDDQRWDTVSAMPALSRMAEQGVYFANSFVTTPVCGPSRVSLLSGRLASTLGVSVNEGVPAQFDSTRTIAVELQRAGYRTALLGKYLNGYHELFPIVAPGWNEWRVFRDGAGELFGPGSLYEDPLWSLNGRPVQDTGYSTDLLARYAVEFIEQNADQPFFLFVSFWAPHVPLRPAERHRGLLEGTAPPAPDSLFEENLTDKIPELRDARRSPDPARDWDLVFPLYVELLLSVDEAVADIREALENLGIDRETIVVFTSDNGFLFGEHGAIGKGLAYEESIRVPLVVWSPQLEAQEVQEQVLNIDLAPTFAELAGTTMPADGRSLVPLLRGEKVPWRRSFEVEWRPGFGLRGRSYRAIRTPFSKYIEWDDGHCELYLLASDPLELEGGPGASGRGGWCGRSRPPRPRFTPGVRGARPRTR